MGAEKFSHEVSSDLATLIPESVYEDEEKRAEWVDQALMLGLRQLAEAFTGIDTSFVRDEFTAVAQEFTKKFIGSESEFNVSLDQFFTDSNSPFVAAFDLDNPNSLICRILDHRDGQNADAIEEEREITRTAISNFSKSMLRQQGADEEAVRGTQQGGRFEQDIVAHLQAWQRFDDSFTPCGEETVEGTRRKVGDVLATIDDGPIIVMEAKAGSNYGQTGDNSLTGQMDASMAFRDASGAIAVTTKRAMDGKGWQRPFMEVGNNRLIVAVDWSPDDSVINDFTALEIAYIYLRYKLTEPSVSSESSGIDLGELRGLIEEWNGSMSKSTKVMKAIADVQTRLTTTYGDVKEMQLESSRKYVEIIAYIDSAEQDAESATE